MKLTVIIPVYNGRENLLRMLESLEQQSSQGFETLLVDDGSKDGSADAIRAYIAEHPEGRIRLTCQENQGAAAARNNGIRETETPYLMFADQDDYLARDYVETYLKAMEETQADIVCGGYCRVHPESGKVLRRVRPGEDSWAKFVVVAPWAHLYRTAFLKENGLKFLKTAIGEDIYFTLMAYVRTDRVVTIPYDGYCWVDNPKSLSNSRQKGMSENVDPLVLLNRLWDDLPEGYRLGKEELEFFLYRYIVWYLLFTTRRTPKETVAAQYERLTGWLKERCPGFEQNRLISLGRPKGEPFGIRLSVWGFNLLYRCGLALPALKVFAAGEAKGRTGE